MASTRPASHGGASGSVTEPSPEQPLSELVSRMTGDLSTLFRKEVELAKIEIKEDAKQTAKAGSLFGAAGLAGYMALLLVSFAFAYLLDLIMPTWLAFLIAGALYGVAAYLLYRTALERFKRLNPVPEETVQTIKEDVEWLKTRKQ
jgi:hypothetical protein